jgi:hypothetical protein
MQCKRQSGDDAGTAAVTGGKGFALRGAGVDAENGRSQRWRGPRCSLEMFEVDSTSELGIRLNGLFVELRRPLIGLPIRRDSVLEFSRNPPVRRWRPGERERERL